MTKPRMAAAFALAVVACACGSPTHPIQTPSQTVPAGPIPVPTSSTTTYSGHYRMTSCSACVSWVDQFWRFTLTVTRTGDSYSARLVTEPWNLVTTLQGSREADGLLRFSGSAGPANSILIGAEFRDFLVREDPQLGLAGTFSYTTLHADGPSATITAVIPSATVGAEPPASAAQSLEGTWTGIARPDGPCYQSDYEPRYRSIRPRQRSRRSR